MEPREELADLPRHILKLFHHVLVLQTGEVFLDSLTQSWLNEVHRLNTRISPRQFRVVDASALVSTENLWLTDVLRSTEVDLPSGSSDGDGFSLQLLHDEWLDSSIQIE